MSNVHADESSKNELILRELDSKDRVNALSLGHADFIPLKMFLKNDAKLYHSKNLAKTYVLVSGLNSNKVLGYITLLCSQISLTPDKSPEDIDAYPYDEYPSIKIVRLAVDSKIKGQGYGETLINWSIAISNKKIMPFVGCRFLVVDSKPSAVKYYQNKGFTILDADENKKSDHPLLFIDLSKIQAIP